MTTHAKVVKHVHAYPLGQSHESFSLVVDSQLFAVPACFQVREGDVVAVLSEHEMRLIQSYRESVKAEP